MGWQNAYVREVDWSFIERGTLVTVQTSPWHLIPHSVTVTSWVADGDLSVPLGDDIPDGDEAYRVDPR